MLAEKFAADIPLPQAGSVGYLRGTAQRCRILRRNPPRSASDGPTCLVQLFDRVGMSWQPVPGSSGNREVPQADIYETTELAMFCGKPPRRTRHRKPGAA